MKPFLKRLQDGETLLCDGGMGSMLIAGGLEPGACPEALNHGKPEILSDIARQYLDAGADILETNTFGGSPLKLGDYQLQNQTDALNRDGVALVRKVVGSRAYIAASCGPSGKILKEFGGDADADTLAAGFEQQIHALAEGGADIICIETMIDIQEATIAVKAAKKVAPTLPVVATMTFDDTPRGFYTIMGITIAKAATELQKAGADVIGSNCGNGLDVMVRIAREFRKETSLPLMIQSNAGIPEIRQGELFYSESPEFFAERIPELLEIGVGVIGGCCGTTPDHIKAIRMALNR